MIDETKRIVEWLRMQLAKGEAATMAATGRRQRDLAAGVVVITNVLKGIEAGDHLKDKTE